MSMLSKMVRTGLHRRPLRITLYGPEGVGKTSFAAGAPKPVFITNEDGGALLDLAAIIVESWRDVQAAIRALWEERHDYQTVVLDTVDHLERLLITHIEQREEAPNIEAVGGGYGKGWEMVRQEWGRTLDELDNLRERGMHVILLAHADARTVKNPSGPDYDQWDLRCNKKTAALLREWPDAVLFANWEITVKTTEKREDKALLGKGKAKMGDRVIYTERGSGQIAKHRFGASFPKELDLDWGDFWTSVEAAYKRAGVTQTQAPKPSDLTAWLTKAATAVGCAPERIDEWRQSQGLPVLADLPESEWKAWLPRVAKADGDLRASLVEWLRERDAIAGEGA
ncbi:MAG: hypothetical protein RJA59_1654, partial [Pseudomonadota bacterium]